MSDRTTKTYENQALVIFRQVGAGFALFYKWIVGILVIASLLLSGCVLPADIREREDGDLDTDAEYEYWPHIVNPQPSTGRVVLAASSPVQIFRIQFAEPPDLADLERLDAFEVRWYLNRSSNPAPLRIVQGWPPDAFREQSLSPRDLYEQLIEDFGSAAGDALAKEGYYYLEVYVSDYGFDPLSDSPDSVPSGAHRDEAAWLIQFDTNTPVEE
jgi:hypothetical protein